MRTEVVGGGLFTVTAMGALVEDCPKVSVATLWRL